MIILGVDPGTASTGYGIIKKSKVKSRKLKVIKYGCIPTKAGLPTEERLKKINNELNKIIREQRPKVLAVENIYFFKNSKTAMAVSQAKGVILLSAAKNKIPIYEFTPSEVKMAVTGYGKADKKQVQKMLPEILSGLKEIPKPDDAADGLAIAYCCANFIRTCSLRQLRSEQNLDFGKE